MIKRILTSLLLILSVILAAVADNSRLAWKNIPLGDGTVTVHSILRGPDGMLWIGSGNGLWSHDGYRPRQCESDNGFADVQVYGIIPLRDSLYLGTNNGLAAMDAATGRIVSLGSGSPTEIRTLALHDSTIWIGTLSGLFTYDLTTRRISRSDLPLPHQTIYSLLTVDAGRRMFVGTYDGLAVYDFYDGKVEPVDLGADQRPATNLFVNSLAYDRPRRRLWIGTEGCLIRYDDRAGRIDGRYLEGNSIKSLAVGQDGTLVAGTDNGLHIIHDDGRHELCRHNLRNRGSIGSNLVWSVAVDTTGLIYAGTEAGLSIADPEAPARVIGLDELSGRSDGNRIYSMLRDSRGDLWLGGTDGLLRVGSGSPMWFSPDDPDHYLAHNRVRDIVETSDGNIWAATDGGINRYDRRRELFDNYHILDSSRRHNANWAYNIIEDRGGKMWIGSYLGGVFRVDPDSLRPGRELNVAERVLTSSDGLTNDLVNHMEIDSRGNKWILLFRDSSVICVTPADEIVRHDILGVCGHYPGKMICDSADRVWIGAGPDIVVLDSTGVSRRITLPADSDKEYVGGMCEVGDEIWVAASSGVWALSSSSDVPRLLPLPSRPYTSVYHDPMTGDVILGSNDGIVRVDPDAVRKRYAPAGDINIMRVLVNGEVVAAPFFTRQPFDRFTIEEGADRLVIEVSTLDYYPSHTQRFAWRIDGVTDGFVMLSADDNVIAVPPLPPGDHVLEIRSTGSSAAGLSVGLTVLRPIYARWYSVLLYILVVAAVILLLVMKMKRREKRRMEKRERAGLLASARHKIDFLASISHDLKTPLSMIIGPVSRLRETTDDEKMRRSLDMIYENALKINTLLHETIEIDRIDADRAAPMIMSKVNAVEFCRSIFDSYVETHPDKHFIFSSDWDTIYVDWDAVKMESVLNNLLSNACKYSGDGATVCCSVAVVGDSVSISISDDGVGIPQSEQSLVFQRMFRSARTSGVREGSGLGLYIVREYVEMHSGTIDLRSVENEGTVFTLSLPLSADGSPREREALKSADEGRPKILIVEDNLAIADFIRSLLEEKYTCHIASNGRAALAVMSSFSPDLIITDEMMPVMSGLDMCRRIKEIQSMSSVPVIMLTAKDDNATETAAAQLGIDSFIAKPFDSHLLMAVVGQKLRSVDEIRRRVRIEQLTAPKPIEAESVVEKQLELITRTIEKHLDNPDLNVNYLSEKTGLGSKQLYRIVKKHMEVTPVEYIRNVRLKKASMLLSQHKFSVSEVMYMVGFSSPSYFSKCFAAQYGCTPSQYCEKPTADAAGPMP